MVQFDSHLMHGSSSNTTTRVQRALMGAQTGTRRQQGRMNIEQPSLLPAFPGLRTHQRALDAGCSVTGATVHQVTAELDHGPILAQAVVPVLPGDTAATLAARVLTQEHRIYAGAIAHLLQNR